MVNQTRKTIIDILLSQNNPVTGIQLGEYTGVSKVAVWKHIQALIHSGYPVISTKAGYILDKKPDIPDEYLVKHNNVSVFHYSEVDTTMSAGRKINPIESQYNLITSDVQINGKGRKGRTWISEKGGIYATLVFKPVFPVQYSGFYTLATALSLIKTLESLYKLKTAFKWPNDLLFEEKKIGGILTEVHGELESPDMCLLGIGLNVHNRITEKKTTSLTNNTNKQISRAEILSEFLKVFIKLLEKTEPSDIGNELVNYSSKLIGKKIFIGESNRPCIIKKLNYDGSIIVDSMNFSKRVYSGDAYNFGGLNG